MNVCAGIPVNDKGEGVCRCCDVVLPLVLEHGDEEPEFNFTPGGFCWDCAFGQCNRVHGDDVEEQEPDVPEIYDAIPCVECGGYGPCAYDDLGRPMIHVTTEEDDNE